MHYYPTFSGTPLICIVEDSAQISNIKIAKLDLNEMIFPSFQTVISRHSPIGKIQYIEICDYTDTLKHQYLFWEEGSGSEQRIVFSQYKQDRYWNTPKYFSPSLFRQHELISVQTSAFAYPPQFSLAIAWHENDSLTIINYSPDSIISRFRIPTYTQVDSVHPAIIDGMITWESHDPSSTLRYSEFDALSDSIISNDTIPSSQNAAYPMFQSYLFNPLSLEKPLCWMKISDGVGNIAGSTRWYDRSHNTYYWAEFSNITNDSAGLNLPIFATISQAIVKTSKTHDFPFDYLVFIKTMSDSNAFVKYNSVFTPRYEFWTQNKIMEIDVQESRLIFSTWIEKSTESYIIRCHIGTRYRNGINEDNPIIPAKFSVDQNYPNPFNSVTTIQYYLPSSGLVTLELFDMLGRKIITLINNRQSNGPHQVRWDAGEFPSGIYFYRLKHNSTSITKKMLLIR